MQRISQKQVDPDVQKQLPTHKRYVKPKYLNRGLCFIVASIFGTVATWVQLRAKLDSRNGILAPFHFALQTFITPWILRMTNEFSFLQEKEQRLRFKEKQKHHSRSPSVLITVGSKHNLSDYFHRRLDDIVQDLHHLVPLFVEKCVRYIENKGKHN